MGGKGDSTEERCFDVLYKEEKEGEIDAGRTSCPEACWQVGCMSLAS